ncbi:MAG: hypothetical protein JWO32_3147 [Bacteroidetes bacterium]|nr:hypothetical protein [Bacteroidota bacterium]
MKSFFIISVIGLLFISQTRSQTYYKLLDKDTTTWQHFNCFIPVGNKMTNSNINVSSAPVATLDSITINTNLYKKVYQLSGSGLNYSGKTLVGYMREDTLAKKVYFRETTTSTEYLLYDFSLNVNDSVFLMFPSGATDNGYYRADSIVTKNERCGQRKHFYMRKHLNNPQPAVKYIEYIESIGSTLHALYPYGSWAINSGCQFSWMGSTCKHEWTLGLACKHNGTKKQYQSCTYTLAQSNGCMTILDSCSYGNHCNGLQAGILPAGITMFPNPARDYLEITFKDNKTHSLLAEVYDIFGKLIITQKEIGTSEKVKISLNGITKGIYLLKIKIDGDKFSKPFFVEE